jgi:methionyl-tRNA synthetase
MDLVNDFGNLLNRSLTMVHKYFSGQVPTFKKDFSNFDEQMTVQMKQTIEDYERLMDALQITEATIKVNSLVSRANKYIDESQPWVLAKDPEKKEQLETVMHHLIHILVIAGKLYAPILVEKSPNYFQQLGFLDKNPNYEDIKSPKVVNTLIIGQPQPLFPRLDGAIELAFIQSSIEKK